MKRSTLLHLRFPFSFFLMPVFVFAFATADNPDFFKTILSFVILHLLVYPASNGYNSYFDKDEDSIGGLKSPPKVSKELYITSLALDVVALMLGFLISWQFVVMIFIYGAISKMYSHPAIRLKKMPIVGWLSAGIFQGYFTFLMSYMAIQGVDIQYTFDMKIQVAAFLSTVILFGSYPMTQVYQHEEDQRRGDITISLLLGVLGTFHFTAISFGIASFGYVLYFREFYSLQTGIIFLIAMSPVLVFFSWWYLKVRKDEDEANFERTMRLNKVSAFMLNLFFFYLSTL